MFCILVVEDDLRVAQLLKGGLEEKGYRVLSAYDGAQALRLLQSNPVDLVVSDVILPQMDGFDLCRQIKQRRADVSVLMLTALGSTDDKLEGFDSGADDYMVKPFDFRELDARIRVLLKRREHRGTVRPEQITYADLQIDLNRCEVHREGRLVKLSPKEYHLLLYMAEHAECVVTRVEIAEQVWNTHFDTGTNFIDVYINYLRKKIDRDFSTKLIHTKPGIGFILTQHYED